MSERIVARLREIERQKGVEILVAVEAGSRAWGFHSPDSDYDVRFIYRRPLAYYLSIHERRDVIEPKCDFPLDFAGWDVKKALFQMHRGNPALFEWLQSPIVYMTSPARSSLSTLMAPYFNARSAIYHYLHMASNNYKTYIEGNPTPRLKKYLYVIRPLFACMYIEVHHTMPPVGYRELVHRIITNGDLEPMQVPVSVWEAESDLLARKMAGYELGEGAAITVLNEWIEEKMAHFGRAARTTAKHNKAADDLDDFFFNIVVP